MKINQTGPAVPSTSLKTHWRIVVLNETHYWNDEIARRAGEIWRAYIFDSRQAVHCCELTPSYELYPLYSTPLCDNPEGDLESEIRDAEGDDVVYYHCRIIAALPASHFYDCGEEELPEDVTWDQAREAIVDQYRCNVVIQFPTVQAHSLAA